MLRCVRTTIDIEPSLLTAAKARASERNSTLRVVFEDALRAELARRPAVAAERVEVRCKEDPETLPGVDLNDSHGLREIMDGRT